MEQEFFSGSGDLATISLFKPLYNLFFAKDLVNGHSIKVCSIESLSHNTGIHHQS